MSVLSRGHKAGLATVAEISEAELMCRMVEAAHNVRRPPGATAEEALAILDEDSHARWRRAARAAVEYWRDCIGQMRQPN